MMSAYAGDFTPMLMSTQGRSLVSSDKSDHFFCTHHLDLGIDRILNIDGA